MNPVIIISVFTFLAATALIGAIVFAAKDFNPTTTEDRLKALSNPKGPGSDVLNLLKDDESGDEILDHVTNLSNKIGVRFHKLNSLSDLIDQADAPISTNTFMLGSAGCLVAGLTAAVLLKSPIPLYPVIGLAFGALPLLVLMYRRKKRFSRFAQQLPDALELMSRALRSGHSLPSGMQVVSQEMLAPIGTEFRSFYDAYSLGTSIDDALIEMPRRMPNSDLKFFVTAVRMQQRCGGNLAEILDKIAYIVRERFKILGQVQALTGEGRMSGSILMALPIVLFITVYQMNPGYVMPLFEDPLGRKMIGVAAGLQFLGAIAIKKIVDIKV